MQTISVGTCCGQVLQKRLTTTGYYVTTVGKITEDAIKKYIQEQSEESRREDSEGAAF